jgi:hypothetical protein
MNHTSVKDFTATLRTSILEVFMFLTFVTACTVIIISRTHSFTSPPRILSQLIDPTFLVVSCPIFDEVHAH